ncbi:MAG: DUF1489 family protein [Rhodobacteraceae bacterium]|nr:DUF1489 family protein [Paracoccaceae bacterium]
MADHIHLVKLCVGAESVADLAEWQESQRPRWPAGRAEHVTRMWPRRQAELLAGGSLYWVIKGQILCRQRLLGLEERRGADGILRCALVLDAAILRTEPVPRAAFQGWRYLAPSAAPRDLPAARPREEALPPGLAAALAEIGLR